MPIDPLHGRFVPEGRDLAAVIQQMFYRFDQEAKQDAARGQIWDPSRIDLHEYARAVEPLMLRYFQMGGYMTYEGLYRSRKQPEDFLQLNAVYNGKKTAGLIEKRLPTVSIGQESLRLSFNVFNQEVLDAVRTMAMNFVRSTLATVVEQVADAYQALREQLGAGLSLGESQIKLTARVQEIFADPDRAFRIATTESSRAMHSGQSYVAKQNGMEFKELLCSADACKLCLSVQAKGPIPINHPYLTGASKNPAYATVMNAPIHVSCQCTSEYS